MRSKYDPKALDEIVSATSGYHIIQEYCSVIWDGLDEGTKASSASQSTNNMTEVKPADICCRRELIMAIEFFYLKLAYPEYLGRLHSP